jgi:hypothetical protein
VRDTIATAVLRVGIFATLAVLTVAIVSFRAVQK